MKELFGLQWWFGSRNWRWRLYGVSRGDRWFFGLSRNALATPEEFAPNAKKDQP